MKPVSGSLDHALANGRRLLASDPGGAARQARIILDADGDQPDALRLLGRALRRLGADEEAVGVERRAVAASSSNILLAKAGQALIEGRLADAEVLLRPYRSDRPDDPVAMIMMADIAAGAGVFDDAEALLRGALELMPSYSAAAFRLARFLSQRGRWREAVTVLDSLLRDDPGNRRYLMPKAAALMRLGDYEAAVATYRRVLDDAPDHAPVWMSYGHALKTVGRLEGAVAAYRQAIEIVPAYGEAWWSLANLKTVRFSDEDMARMTVALDGPELDDSSRLHLHFALGKALEDGGAYAESFRHYAEGNRVRRAMLSYDPAATTAEVDRSIALFTRHFFAERGGDGNAAPDPIFIVGMPRAGSTLTEQILASHSKVEGLAELPHIPLLVQQLVAERAHAGAVADYPQLLRGIDRARLRAFGDAYLAAAAEHRVTGRRHFVDKLPNNWLYVGLIRLALPNARIVDVRRHPLDCCFSNFKQHFANGQPFAYALDELGSYYRDYVRLMDHFDSVLPGAVHRLFYEDMVASPEREVRRLLDFLGLQFEAGCLAFHENRRAVRTASAEQVRRPINRDGLGRWSHFDAWLAPLKDALGPLAADYPGGRC